MVAFDGKEWGYPNGSTQSIVVRELSQGYQFRPVVLLVVAVYMEILF